MTRTPQELQLLGCSLLFQWMAIIAFGHLYYTIAYSKNQGNQSVFQELPLFSPKKYLSCVLEK